MVRRWFMALVACGVRLDHARWRERDGAETCWPITGKKNLPWKKIGNGLLKAVFLVIHNHVNNDSRYFIDLYASLNLLLVCEEKPPIVTPQELGGG